MSFRGLKDKKGRVDSPACENNFKEDLVFSVKLHFKKKLGNEGVSSPNCFGIKKYGPLVPAFILVGEREKKILCGPLPDSFVEKCLLFKILCQGN